MLFCKNKNKVITELNCKGSSNNKYSMTTVSYIVVFIFLVTVDAITELICFILATASCEGHTQPTPRGIHIQDKDSSKIDHAYMLQR